GDRRFERHFSLFYDRAWFVGSAGSCAGGFHYTSASLRSRIEGLVGTLKSDSSSPRMRKDAPIHSQVQRFCPDGRQPFPYWSMEGLPVIRPELSAAVLARITSYAFRRFE